MQHVFHRPTPHMTSIASKIRKGAYLYVGLALVFAALAYSDLRYLQWRVESGLTVYEMIDTLREARRHEKNLFLYDAESELDASLSFIDRASTLLATHAEAFAPLESHVPISSLRPQIHSYHSALQDYRRLLGADVEQQQAARTRIREQGHRLQAQLDTLQMAERAELRQAVGGSLLMLIAGGLVIALVGIGAAWLFARLAVRPMNWLEQQLAAIGKGRLQGLEPPSQDQELVSLARAVERMNQEIETRNRQLLQSEKLASLGTLVTGIAHELNNPLSNISSSCQILQEEWSRSNQTDPTRWLRQIDDESERAKGIVQTVLSFAREREFHRQWWPLREILEEAMTLLTQLEREQVTLDIAAELHASVDKQRLLQVLVNLLANALDAGGPKVAIHIRAELVQAQDFDLPADSITGRRPCPPHRKGPLLRIDIRDDGPGIPAQTLPRIFDPFFTTKDVGQGYGLGLYVSQAIIDQHEGCIAVVSPAGEGSHFILAIPYETEAQDS
ncbi:MAG: HAMP domain-containing histidine kinase [Gammaproteobacteria bacterium]|nr:HAMP domain-containing histidine kinase [Gammaproteobacteria bacterium]